MRSTLEVGGFEKVQCVLKVSGLGRERCEPFERLTHRSPVTDPVGEREGTQVESPRPLGVARGFDAARQNVQRRNDALCISDLLLQTEAFTGGIYSCVDLALGEA